MGKGEIVRYEQFLLFPQCFQEACLASKGVIVWEWVKAVDCLIEVISNTGLIVWYGFHLYQCVWIVLQYVYFVSIYNVGL